MACFPSTGSLFFSLSLSAAAVQAVFSFFCHKRAVEKGGLGAGGGGKAAGKMGPARQAQMQPGLGGGPASWQAGGPMKERSEGRPSCDEIAANLVVLHSGHAHG